MKITKQQLRQIIKEEIEKDTDLLDAINNLTKNIKNLDVSIDFLSSAVTGEDTLPLGWAQSVLGRSSRPKKTNMTNKQLEEESGEITEQNSEQDSID
jgi:hypothetical protein